ncbi:MAG: ABC transporter permease [Chloroflexi bacterium]|nr:ABC transporter permease [Chloroflexota bacterium]
MLAYIVRRLGYAVLMLVLVSFVSFLIIDLPPGDYLTQKMAELQAQGDRSAESRIEEYRVRYGLDKPLLTRYVIWITNFVQGDFGESFAHEVPVRELIGQRFAMTAIFAVASIILVWLIAVPIGVYSAVNQYSFGDQLFTSLSFFGIGTPSFMLAMVVLFVAVVILDLDVIGLFSREFEDAPWSLAKVWDLLKHLWVPALISAVTESAGMMRIMRGNMLETLGQPFIEAARARGLRNTTVTWKHAVRIAINPLVVMLGGEQLPKIIGGNALIAIVLNLPTISPMFVDALLTQDSYMAGTILVFLTLILLVGNLLSDLVLSWIDPRIRLD